MIKLVALLLLCSLVTGQMTLGASLRFVYGTVDTFESAFQTVHNIFDPNAFRGNGLNPEGNDPDNPFGLGVTDINADAETQSVFDLLTYYYRVYNVVGLDGIRVKAVYPYELMLYDPKEADGASVDYIGVWQCLVTATYGNLPYSAYWLFPTDPKSTEYFYVAYSLGANRYQRIERTHDYFEALQLSGIGWNTAFVEEYDGAPTLLEVWLTKIYD